MAYADAPSAQLHQDLRDAITRELQTGRPLLHHLNADSSWLLQVPRPVVATRRGGRVYYNILIDPWLAGGQSDVAKWFSQQWHAVESATPSIAAVEELARETEILAAGLRLGKDRVRNGEEMDEEIKTFIDAVAISHEFTDHCHKETLTAVDPDVPVFATEKAAALITSWNHFRHVSLIPPFTSEDPDWRSTSLPPLPEWLSISRLQEPGDALYYHSAIMIAFASPPSAPSTPPPRRSSKPSRSARTLHNGWTASSTTSDAAESVIYTPHGIRAAALTPLTHASPPISTLAFLHGLHDISLWRAQQLNLGAANGLRCQRVLHARYWVGTHDEAKRGGGLVSWFLRRKVGSVGQALGEERRRRKEEGGADGGEEEEGEWGDVRFEEVPNGETRVLR